MNFSDMAHDQNNNSFHRPTSLMLETTLVSGILENVVFGKRKVMQ